VVVADIRPVVAKGWSSFIFCSFLGWIVKIIDVKMFYKKMKKTLKNKNTWQKMFKNVDKNVSPNLFNFLFET